MLPLQRKQAVLNYLAQRGAATMKELSDHFGVSEMTIRRDLTLLEQELRVTRSHGGVVYNDTGAVADEPDLATKLANNGDVKDKLAAYAAEHFVRSSSVNILENGTTVSRMADYLGAYDNLTLVTNGIDTLGRIRPLSAKKHTIISCGGMLREVSGTFVGPVAEEFFKRYHADTLFLSALGYSHEEGFTDPNLMDTQVKKAMMRSAEKVVILLDSSKIGKRFFSTVAHLGDIHAFVTDERITDADRHTIEEGGAELHIV
ncbi:DeoR/GlpR family DNA-binding transcription regulator [Paenibacillus sp. OV219]|uniref:DeoR/GlpR family DNA-binding transcription regulator n=1 Tax=Paenibacillus sp. OV219 TaxID=1884377 RepID=UPI0008C156B0|nr:DeoR/GlpR family DNA-binding transcription regulator [Paenibacillus sp. OV219]SEO54438.1 transcriptional regulator, DeoR family [Paenibacillus sp. OV219]